MPDAEEMPQDATLQDAALNGIAQLNQRYGTENAARFHLFHRQRLWNPSEEKWMGWERKRGKLEEFNRLVTGSGPTTFVVQTADEALLRRIRYVITLDSDTQLPRDVARKLVGAAVHPLNRPRFDAKLTASSKVMEFCNRESAFHLKAHPVHGLHVSSPATPGSIRIPPQFPTFTRICLGKGVSPAKACMT